MNKLKVILLTIAVFLLAELFIGIVLVRFGVMYIGFGKQEPATIPTEVTVMTTSTAEESTTTTDEELTEDSTEASEKATSSSKKKKSTTTGRKKSTTA